MGTPTEEDYRDYLARIAHLDDLLDQVRDCYQKEWASQTTANLKTLATEDIRLALRNIIAEHTDDMTFDEKFMQWWKDTRDQREHDEATVVGHSEDVAIGPRR